MYLNYGDVNFFDYGRLVDAEHSDTVLEVITCDPYCDTENLYQFGVLSVDITDTWINKSAVCEYIGADPATVDPVQYALGCISYYGGENFGEVSDLNHDEICDRLKHQLIASDNLHIEW